MNDLQLMAWKGNLRHSSDKLKSALAWLDSGHFENALRDLKGFQALSSNGILEKLIKELESKLQGEGDRE